MEERIMHDFFDRIKKILATRPNLWRKEIEENILDEFLELYEVLDNRTIYMNSVGLTDNPKSSCGNPSTFISLKDGFSEYCTNQKCLICSEVKSQLRLSAINKKLDFKPTIDPRRMSQFKNDLSQFLETI